MMTITHPADAVSLYSIPGIRSRKHTMNSIAEAISEVLHVPIETMKIKTRKFYVVRARQICAYFMRDYGYTFGEIGGYFLKDHATIIHSVRTIDAEMKYNKDLRELIVKLRNGILHKGSFNKQW